ncbi:MAG: polysaccharide lyase family 1 protein [Myxococcota bacterium]
MFEVTGEIALRSQVRVGNDQTIDGRGQQVVLTGRGLRISGRRNVVIHNLEIRACEGDAISVYQSEGVWIDHVSLSDCRDGLIDITEQSTDVTVSWSRLHNHNKAMLIGANNTRTADRVIRVTLHHNVFENTARRNPLVRFGSVHMFNNHLLHWGEGAGGDAVNATCFSQVFLENNVFEADRNRMATRTSVPNYIPDEGYIRAVGNWTLGGAVIEEAKPAMVFDPSTQYAYTAELADAALQTRLANGAGTQVTSPPPGI